MKRTFALLICLAMLCLSAAPAMAADAPLGARPSGICAGAEGLVVTDVFNKLVLQGQGEAFSVLAGVPGPAGADGEPAGIYVDGVADGAYFMLPWDVVPFMEGYAVSDTDADVIRYVANGSVRTLVAKNAGLSRPTGLATDGKNLYISDAGSGRLIKMDQQGKLSVLVQDLVAPAGLDWSGDTLYICESGRHRVLALEGAKLRVVAGQPASDGEVYLGGFANGPVAQASFDRPSDVLVKGKDLYVADTGNMAIRLIRDGAVYTLAEGEDTDYLISMPRGLALQGDTLYVADLFYPYPVALSLAAKSFSDVSAALPEAEAIAKAAEMRLIQGFGDGTFRPDEIVNRAQFVTMLGNAWRYLDGQIVLDGENIFADIDGSEWYAACIRWAGAEGLLWGRIIDGARVADPATPIKGAEAALLLERFAGAQSGLTAPEIPMAADAPVTRAQAASLLVRLLEGEN